MPPKPAFFGVSPRLAVLLGESYRSAELALKELVDNAWDANAGTVDISIPSALTKDAKIVIADTGEGMSREQVEGQYLRIARDRLKERGTRTGPPFNRQVKGRKGVGKFAGIVIAEVMDVETRQKGKVSRFRIDRTALEQSSGDIFKIEVDIETTDCDPTDSGTTITLSHLAQTINFPTPESLRHALAPDYGREERFAVLVNGNRLDHMQMNGHKASLDLPMPGVPDVRLELVIGDKRLPKDMQGVVVKVKGKIVGRPRFFGLEQDETVPPRLLHTVSGVLYADDLEDEASRSGWTDLNESEKRVQIVFAQAASILKEQLNLVYRQQMSAARARFMKKYLARLRELPEHKREFAKRELENIVTRYLGNDERTADAIELMLKGLEQDEYWAVMNALINANPADIATVAEALSRFGVIDLAMVARGTKARLDALESMRILAGDMDTLEIRMHETIKGNLWIFGSDYALLSSNQALQTIVPRALSSLMSTKDASKRPDLLLLSMFKDRHLLVEFKRPSETLDETDRAQAEKYRRLLAPYVTPVEIVVLGGRRVKDMPQEFENGTVKMLSYTELLSKAESELRWLLTELRK
ncbi:MAG: ATP-binding protein [Hyphomicrobiaceae bacterium]|nr:ATP-binding protein [Hyphomicrobiaceae bacterium]